MTNVLIVGQTPPPVNGQTLMIQALLDGKYPTLRLHHVRMAFSRSIDEVGTFKARKLLLLGSTLLDIVRGRIRSRSAILYFPPTGPTFIPVVRDIALLIATRWMFRYTVFHFHAAGLTEIYARLPWFMKPLFRLAYRNADVAIFTAKSQMPMGHELGAKHVVAAPYGILDHAEHISLARVRQDDHVPSILFMGILCDGKGLFTLIEACALLRKAGHRFQVTCGGTWDSETSPEQVVELLDSHGLKESFAFPGVLLGKAKSKAFEDADIFCFPSHYHAESSPVVLTEAMSYQLPIVTTKWRGIPDVVGESGGAFMVEPRRPDLVAENLERLIKDGSLRLSMGQKNRAWFCAHGTILQYQERIQRALLSATTPATDQSSV